MAVRVCDACVVDTAGGRRRHTVSVLASTAHRDPDSWASRPASVVSDLSAQSLPTKPQPMSQSHKSVAADDDDDDDDNDNANNINNADESGSASDGETEGAAAGSQFYDP